ncbi:MAG: TonB-dependent receptor [Balneolaceae bacterium]|nr:TonB-dependent receptor [Balneolaceae bacterium]
MKLSRFYPAGLYLCTLVLFGILLAPATSWGQDQATLRVVVSSDQDGSPIPSANVVLLSPDETEREEEGILHAGASDSDGLVELADVVPGEYLLRVTFVGHKTHRDTIRLAAGERRVIQVALAVDVETLGQVVVESEREVTVGEVGVNRISEIDVARIPTPSPGGDLASYLQTLPGVVSAGDRGGNLYIRGGTPYQNLILVDNMPVVKPFHISNLYSAFSDATLQSADMHAGGFGAEYLGASSAVIDLSLRQGNMKDFNANGSLGSHMVALQAEGPLQTDHHSFMLMGRKSLIEDTSPTLIGEEDPIDFYDVLGRYSYQDSGIACNVTALHTNDRGEINPNRAVDISWSNSVLGGRCLSFDEYFNRPIEVTVGFSRYSNSESTAEETELYSSMEQQFLKLDHAFEGFGTLLEYGFGVNFTRYEAELAERFAQQESFSNRTAVIDAYVSTDLEIGDRLTLQPSMGSQLSLHTTPTFEPRFRASYLPGGTGSHEVSLAFGRYYQISDAITDERDAGTTFAVMKGSEWGDPNQGALHGILGYRLRLPDGFEAKVEAYVKRHSDIPVSRWSPETQIEMETALADGMTYGADVRLEYDNSPLYLFLGYGYSQVEYEASSGNLGAWIKQPVYRYNPTHDRRHKLNTVASYTFGGFTTSLSWEFGTGRPYTRVYGFDLRLQLPGENPLEEPGTARTLYSRPYGDRLPMYHRLDVSLERTFRFSQGVTLETKVGMINSYNRKNVFYYDANLLQRVNQTPRMPYASMSINFN